MIAKLVGSKGAGYLSTILRIGVGLTFIMSGWAKFNTGMSVQFFTQQGILLPEITGPFISIVELFGGLCILLGVGTRVAAFLLICDMTVAILAVRLGLNGAQGTLLAVGLPGGWNALRTELMLLLSSLVLLLNGPGPVSVETNVLKRELP